MRTLLLGVACTCVLCWTSTEAAWLPCPNGQCPCGDVEYTGSCGQIFQDTCECRWPELPGQDYCLGMWYRDLLQEYLGWHEVCLGQMGWRIQVSSDNCYRYKICYNIYTWEPYGACSGPGDCIYGSLIDGPRVDYYDRGWFVCTGTRICEPGGG